MIIVGAQDAKWNAQMYGIGLAMIDGQRFMHK
jgi:hypothetical protein